MRKIVVEWFHYDKVGQICCRCSDGTETVKSVIDRMKPSLRIAGIELELKEILLDENNIKISNTIKINGKDIMNILDERQGIMTLCPSCSELIGRETVCNTFMYKGKYYDVLPEEMLAEAISKESFGVANRGRK